MRIEKRIPVAAGLGGGSADAAAALRLANGTLDLPLPRDDLHDIAARLGADVPFFLGDGTQLATGDGTVLERIELPLDYWILIVVPDDARKESTRDVYDAFDDRDGRVGVHGESSRTQASAHGRRESSRPGRAAPERPRVLAPRIPTRACRAPFARTSRAPARRVYGLFESEDDASRAADALAHVGRTLVTRPAEAGDRPRVAR